MLKKILVVLFIGLFSLLNTGLVYAGFFDNSNSQGNNLSASTLFFDITDTADNPLFVPLFYVSDLKPGDFKSTTFRIYKRGSEDFKYNIYFSKTGGDDNLCNALRVEAKLDGTTFYNNNLKDLSIFPRVEITDGMDQWEITISLLDSSSDLREKSCSFDITVKGWQIDSNGSWGFFDLDSLNSDISTTTWEVLTLSLESVNGSEDSQLDSFDSQEQVPSAQLDPEVPKEPALPEETGDPITPTPTPTSVLEEEQIVSPIPEDEQIPTPTLQEQEEEVDQVDVQQDIVEEDFSEVEQNTEETEATY